MEKRAQKSGVLGVFAPGLGPTNNEPFAAREGKSESSAKHFKRMLEELNQSHRRWNTAGLQSVMKALVGDESSAIVGRLNVSAKSYQEHLRDHVDLWLATGRAKSGVDTPANRKPTKIIHDIVQRIFETHHAIPIPLKDGYTVSPVPYAPLIVGGDQGLSRAETMFVDMLISDWRLRIAKCAKCGIYFKLHHWERPYESGTVCVRCMPQRKNDRSKQYIKEKRQKAEKELHMKAARRFAKRILGDPNWHENHELRRKIIEYLAQLIGKSPELQKRYSGGAITGKWLSWNKNRIAIETEAKKIAKGI